MQVWSRIRGASRLKGCFQVASAGRTYAMRLSGATRRSVLRWNPPRRALSSVRAASSPAPTADLPSQQDRQKEWELRLLYDGECPLCLKEINMLKKRDEGQHKISFVNIATPEYEPTENAGISYGQAMRRIHGILPDGRVLKGVEAFRQCYELVGLGWVYAMTSFKPIERFANVVYDIWAKWRLPLTGRSNEGIEELTYWSKGPKTCADDEYCELEWEQDDDSAHQKGDPFNNTQKEREMH